MAERQPRRTKEDLRSLLLDAAQTILREEGLGVGTDALTFKRVFDRVEQDTGLRLTNASVIRRVWENQAEYHTDVLIDILNNDDNTEEFNDTFGVAGRRGGQHPRPPLLEHLVPVDRHLGVGHRR